MAIRRHRPALALYRQFVIEARFGFNRMTPSLFFADLLKHTLLGIVIGTPVILAVLWLMAAMGSLWWLLRLAVLVRLQPADPVRLPDLDRAAVQQIHAARRGEMKARIEACWRAAASAVPACS
jgi:STE24 endopeptidase